VNQKWVTAIGGIIAAVVPLLVAYGIVTNEQATLWQNLVLAIVAAVVPIVVGSLVRNYNDNETAARVALMENETARLMAGREVSTLRPVGLSPVLRHSPGPGALDGHLQEHRRGSHCADSSAGRRVLLRRPAALLEV
jgi:hypothetical protein